MNNPTCLCSIQPCGINHGAEINKEFLENGWQDVFPLNTFKGETKKQLISFIKILKKKWQEEQRGHDAEVALEAIHDFYKSQKND